MSIRKDSWRPGRLAAWGLILAAATAIGAVGVHEARSVAIDNERLPLIDGRVPGGSLLLVGGGRVTPEIRERFVELAGGHGARIVVIPASEPLPGDDERYLGPWRASGALSVTLLNARDRDTADDPRFCEPIRTATGVWFGGGSQALLAQRYVDTPVERALRELLDRNGVIGGCSAGAALLSRVMIEQGEDRPIEARGLNLIANAIVDQHFLKRNRLWRLQQMLESHPELIGLGIDERTALVIGVRSWRMNVVGESYVLACLPAHGESRARIEILKPGDNVSLSQLRETHLAYHPPLE